MTPEQLFVRAYDDLDEKSGSKDEYILLRAAAVLRQLLLEEHPLVHKVNRSERLQLKFRFGLLGELPPDIPQPVTHVLQEGIDHETIPTMNVNFVKNGDMKTFLSNPIVRHEGQTFTVA